MSHTRPRVQARLKLYEVKVQGAAEAAWLAQHRPSTQVNVNAANRFISHALPDLSQEQRAALKQVRLCGRRWSYCTSSKLAYKCRRRHGRQQRLHNWTWRCLLTRRGKAV